MSGAIPPADDSLLIANIKAIIRRDVFGATSWRVADHILDSAAREILGFVRRVNAAPEGRDQRPETRPTGRPQARAEGACAEELHAKNQTRPTGRPQALSSPVLRDAPDGAPQDEGDEKRAEDLNAND